jgi:hypothetical protein
MTTVGTKNEVYMARLERRLPLGFNIELALYEAREWIIECLLVHYDLDESLEMVENMGNENVVKYVALNWAGGLENFAALAPELAL